jgi:hypothetical protein
MNNSLSQDEAARVAAVRSHNVIGTSREPDYDEIAKWRRVPRRVRTPAMIRSSQSTSSVPTRWVCLTIAEYLETMQLS